MRADVLTAEIEPLDGLLTAIREVTAALLAGDDDDDEPDESGSLSVLAESARALVHADTVTVAVPVDDGNALLLLAAEGVLADRLRNMPFAADESIAGEVVQTGRAIVLDDVSVHPRRRSPMVRVGDFGPAMFVPLGHGQTVLGALSAARVRGERPFSPKEFALLQVLAEQASVVLRFERAERARRRVAAMAERERLATELHDTLLQRLFAIASHLQVTYRNTDREEDRERVSAVLDELDSAIVDIRTKLLDGLA